MNWSDKVVLITGASSGIGRGLAIELAKRGAAIGLLARRAGLLGEIANEISARGGRAIDEPRAGERGADAPEFRGREHVADHDLHHGPLVASGIEYALPPSGKPLRAPPVGLSLEWFKTRTLLDRRPTRL